MSIEHTTIHAQHNITSMIMVYKFRNKQLKRYRTKFSFSNGLMLTDHDLTKKIPCVIVSKHSELHVNLDILRFWFHFVNDGNTLR
jgi:hypothetical protein